MAIIEPRLEPPGEAPWWRRLGWLVVYWAGGPGLSAGATYYFAVTAYDVSRNESGYSAEVSKLAPLPWRFTEASLFTPNTSEAPSARACAR